MAAMRRGPGAGHSWDVADLGPRLLFLMTLRGCCWPGVPTCPPRAVTLQGLPLHHSPEGLDEVEVGKLVAVHKGLEDLQVDRVPGRAEGNWPGQPLPEWPGEGEERGRRLLRSRSVLPHTTLGTCLCPLVPSRVGTHPGGHQPCCPPRREPWLRSWPARSLLPG